MLFMSVLSQQSPYARSKVSSRRRKRRKEAFSRIASNKEFRDEARMAALPSVISSTRVLRSRALSPEMNCKSASSMVENSAILMVSPRDLASLFSFFLCEIQEIAFFLSFAASHFKSVVRQRCCGSGDRNASRRIL